MIARPEPTTAAEGVPTAYRWFIAGVGSWFTSWGMQGVLYSWLVVGELHAPAEVVGTSDVAACA